MRKVTLFLFLFLLNACSVNSPEVPGEINQVTVVKYTPYVKQHRAYFERTQLKVIKDGKQYLYLYHAKENDLAILLHRQNQYILYNLSQPDQQPFVLNASSKTSYTHALKILRRKGFKTITALTEVGHTATVSLRRYKGFKTLLVETKDYSHLQDLYQQSIRSYNADKIKNIQTLLPKPFISDYYTRYEKKAETEAQLVQLQIIAQKLQIKTKISPAKEVKKEETQIIEDKPLEEEASNPETSETSYAYYLKDAPLDELSTYIAQSATKNALSYSQYKALKRKKALMEEEKLFSEGSLEDLIAAYKINKNPKYKKRIMMLMKEVQAP